MSKETPDIVTVIDSYAPLEHTGSIYRGLCPFCHSMEGKLIVRPDIQTWHCFECGAGGDVYDFVAMYANVGRDQAARLLTAQDDANIQLSVEQEEPALPTASVPTATPAPAATPTVAPTAPAESGGAEWSAPDTGPYYDYFLRLRRLKGYRLAAILDTEHLLAVDNPAGEDPPLGGLAENLTALASKADSLFGATALGESYEVLFEGETDALICLAFQRDGLPLRVLLLLNDKTQIYLARMQAASLRNVKPAG